MRQVKIAELKDRLSEHLRAVENGAEVIVMDRNRAIARIVPLPPPGRHVRLLPPSRGFPEIRDRRRAQRRLAGPVDRASPGGATGSLNVYVDSSVLLRVVLGEPDRLDIWPTITNPVSSELIRLECLRTIDRARVRLGLDDRQIANYRADVLEAIDAFSLVALDSVVLERAAEPFPTALGSLDAIHLASALLTREQPRRTCVRDARRRARHGRASDRLRGPRGISRNLACEPGASLEHVDRATLTT